MEQTQEQTFEAWVDEKRRLASFHKIPGARRYCAPERAFLGAGNRAGALGLPGAIGRVKTGAPVGCKKEDAPLIKAGRLPGRRASLYYGYI